MLSVTSATRIFVHSLPTDMRCQFDGLRAIVTHTMKQDIFTGDYFVFFNRRCTHCKVICWEGDGFAMWAKRLERNCFQRPQFKGDSLSLEVDRVTLMLILSGIDLKSAHRRPRYQLPAPSTSIAPTSTASPNASAPAIDTAARDIHSGDARL